MKKILLAVSILLIVGVVVFFATRKDDTLPYFPQNTTKPAVVPSKDHKNIAYTIDGESFLLVNGIAEKPYPALEQQPGEVTTVRYFGNEAKGDLNGDGKEDIVFLVTEESGGTGVFYYAVAALGASTGFTGTNAVFLGDRIAPQTTEFRGTQVVVNFADRAPGEPMVAEPTIGFSKTLKYSNGELQAVE